MLKQIEWRFSSDSSPPVAEAELTLSASYRPLVCSVQGRACGWYTRPSMISKHHEKSQGGCRWSKSF